jgi:hypothetical protein
MTDLFITNTKDRPCISPPVYNPPPLPGNKPIENRLRKNIRPGLIVGGRESEVYGNNKRKLIPQQIRLVENGLQLCCVIYGSYARLQPKAPSIIRHRLGYTFQLRPLHLCIHAAAIRRDYRSTVYMD